MPSLTIQQNNICRVSSMHLSPSHYQSLLHVQISLGNNFLHSVLSFHSQFCPSCPSFHLIDKDSLGHSSCIHSFHNVKAISAAHSSLIQLLYSFLYSILHSNFLIFQPVHFTLHPSLQKVISKECTLSVIIFLKTNVSLLSIKKTVLPN